MKVLLLIEFMWKLACVNPCKERLSERLSARRKRKVYWGSDGGRSVATCS